MNQQSEKPTVRAPRPSLGFEVDTELHQRIQEERWLQRKSLSELIRGYVVRGLDHDAQARRLARK